jgi:hypothetical protein
MAAKAEQIEHLERRWGAKSHSRRSIKVETHRIARRLLKDELRNGDADTVSHTFKRPTKGWEY